ncbi:MAG: nucleotidyltransferase domain-containing protein [Methanolinea sp.]|nr:nucleotidyltransferase domain-containing protein [Methanolinea sp.]
MPISIISYPMVRAEEFLAEHPDVAEVVGDIPKGGVIAIILFGSHATGRAGPLSDIDLCIVTEKPLPGEEKDSVLSHASRKISLSLFWDLPPAVRFRALKEGVLLWGTPDLRLQRIKVQAVRAYLNVKPLLERHAKKILGV